jgi:isopentenyl-diphosphate delta-isomerase
MPDGVRENEMCPVFTAVTSSALVASAAEVAETQWVDWSSFRDAVLDGTRDVSPWCVQQVCELALRESPSGRFRAALADSLPPAAR